MTPAGAEPLTRHGFTKTTLRETIMAATGYHDAGEEFAHKATFRDDLLTRPGTVSVTLYNDATDSLSDSDDISNISTEPTGASFSRQSVSIDSSDVSLSQSGGDLRAEATVSFDTSDSTQTIDAYAIVVNFQSDVVNNDSSPTDHLLTSATVGQTIDLSSGNDTVDLNIDIDLN
jgi:hypothetical protein